MTARIENQEFTKVESTVLLLVFDTFDPTGVSVAVFVGDVLILRLVEWPTVLLTFGTVIIAPMAQMVILQVWRAHTKFSLSEKFGYLPLDGSICNI